MSRLVRLAWFSFGLLLDFSPKKSTAGVQIRALRRELAKRDDGRALAGDYRRVGNDIKSAMSRYDA